MSKHKHKHGPVCVWEQDTFDDAWETSCGEMFQFTEGGPRDNKMRFCCYCGLLLKARPAEHGMGATEQV